MNLPKRKPTRLKYYDYSQNGAYFVTICTHNRKHLLSKIVGGGFHILPQNTMTPDIVGEGLCALPQNITASDIVEEGLCALPQNTTTPDIVGEGLCALPQNIMTPIGKEVEKSIQYINCNYVGVKIDKYVIMPNHIHLIVMLDDSGGHRNPPLQSIIGQLKSHTTNKFGGVLWQRSFHDHIIRGERDYRKIWEYIDTNVLKWEQDCFYGN